MDHAKRSVSRRRIYQCADKTGRGTADTVHGRYGLFGRRLSGVGVGFRGWRHRYDTELPAYTGQFCQSGLGVLQVLEDFEAKNQIKRRRLTIQRIDRLLTHMYVWIALLRQPDKVNMEFRGLDPHIPRQHLPDPLGRKAFTHTDFKNCFCFGRALTHELVDHSVKTVDQPAADPAGFCILVAKILGEIHLPPRRV